MTSTYERLDAAEVESVRAHRRQLWTERAHRDKDGARAQVVDAIRQHSDPWVDGINLVTLVSVALRDKTIGDLSTSGRYALITLLGDAA